MSSTIHYCCCCCHLCSYPAHDNRTTFAQCKDMNQAITVDLLNLAANALQSSTTLRTSMFSANYAVQLCKAYRDPYMLCVIKDAMERADLRRDLESRGWTEARVHAEVEKLKQQQKEHQQLVRNGEVVKPFMGGLMWYIVRFWNVFVQVRRTA